MKDLIFEQIKISIQLGNKTGLEDLLRNPECDPAVLTRSDPGGNTLLHVAALNSLELYQVMLPYYARNQIVIAELRNTQDESPIQIVESGESKENAVQQVGSESPFISNVGNLIEQFDGAVFHLTAPHDEPNRGDTDYVREVIAGIKDRCLNPQQLCVMHITGNNFHTDGMPLYDLNAVEDGFRLSDLKIRENPDSLLRQMTVARVIDYLEKFPADKKMIHLQFRPPETGCMFHPRDIDTLKSKGIKVTMTVHECLHNQKQTKKPYFKEMLERADHVIFLNPADLDFGVAQLSAVPAISLSAVPPTVPPQSSILNSNAILTKEPNILVFGLMRTKKGFEQAIDLAKEIQTNDIKFRGKQPQVIIAGKPHDLTLARKLVRSAYGVDVSKKEEKKLSKEKKQILDGLAPTPREIKDYKQGFMISTNADHIASYILEQCQLQNKPISDDFKEYLDKIAIGMATSISNGMAPDRVQNIWGEELSGEGFDVKNIGNELKELLIKCKNRTLPADIDQEYSMEYLVNAHKRLQEEGVVPGLPLQIHFNVDAAQFDLLCQQSKYCLKWEDKGMARNSSSIINCLARGLITYVRQGDITPDEFKDSGENASIVILDANDFKDFKPTKMLQEIVHREGQAGQSANRASISAMENSLENLFNRRVVGEHHIAVYSPILELEITRNPNRVSQINHNKGFDL